MRASAIVAGAIIFAGIYLAIAATVGIGTTWTALGILAIAVVAAIAMVAAPVRPADSRRGPHSGAL